MLQTEQTKRNFCEEEGLLVHEYLNIEVKEETELNKQNKNIGSQGLEISHSTSSFDSFALPDFIKVELNESENQLGKINSCENDNYNFESDIQDGFITKDCLTVTESEKKIYSEVIVDDSETFSNDSTWGHLQNLTPNFEFLPNVTPSPSEGIRGIKKDKRGTCKSNEASQLNPWESERIFKRREQNRKRKAHQRAQETEEQRTLRREKERLAKAALRATETMEKRLARRERDRIAKAISRAVETDEQRRIRREKNRLAMAALRAAQTDEERYKRREKDRIKKAKIRAFETEEQKRIRREKNRIAMALRRAIRSSQERNYMRHAKIMSKSVFRSSCLMPLE